MYYEKNTLKNGFTLNEILMVIIVLSALVALALPRFATTFEATRAGEGFQILDSLLKAQKGFHFENPTSYADSMNKLDVEITSANFDPPTVFDTPIAPGKVAEIVRTGGLYTLAISETGQIKCTAGTTPCAKIRCRGALGECN